MRDAGAQVRPDHATARRSEGDAPSRCLGNGRKRSISAAPLQNTRQTDLVGSLGLKSDRLLDLAHRAYAARPGALHGVGFCMTGLQGVAAVDLDRCSAPDGTPAPWARDVLERALAEGGYCERSPSGTGFRIFMHDDEIDDDDWNNHDVGIEVYVGTAPRFLTVTGHPWRPAT